MKLRYDPRVDALYISFKKGPVQVTTVRLSEDVAVDLGPNEEVVGIEVLGASEHLALAKTSPTVILEGLQAEVTP